MILCFILFIGVWIYKLQSTRLFLEHQLEAHAQDTATSLALSMSPLVAADDQAGVETMMNAIFDRGYYKEITFSDVEGEVVSKRLASLVIAEVPQWFIEMLPISSPGGNSLIMAGWKQAGTLYVESHPGYAYRSLWHTFVRILLYFLLTGLVVFVLGGIGLNFLLRPLRKVEQQAEAICRREYEIQEQIPRTRELRSVVNSMNRMTSRVREMFEEQAQIAEKLRENVFGDQLTGLANRRFLETRIDSVMNDSPQMAKGLFLILQIRHLKKLNESQGYAKGDRLIKRCAEVLTDTMTQYPGHSLARISGGDFGIFLPDADKTESQLISSAIADRVYQLVDEDLSISDDIFNLGGVYYNTPCSFGHLLAKSDTALIAARHSGPNSWKLEPAYCDDDDPTQGKTWWRSTLERSLANRAINLYGQQVITIVENETLHVELFSRITLDNGQEVAAGVFIPLAEYAAVVTQLDRKVIELVLDTYQSWENQVLAINLSVTALLDQTFTDWLLSRLKTLSDRNLRLYFEFSELSAVKQIDTLRTFAEKVRTTGHHIGVDHFGRGFSNFGYLKSLQPSYVKIDAAFTRELESPQSESYFFIGALIGVAHSLGINVIAKGVETDEQRALLTELKVDGYQGYLIQRPQLLSSKV